MSTIPTLPMTTTECQPAPPDDAIRLPAKPGRRVAFNGWTPARQAAFLQALRDTGSVTQAARQVGMGREGVYQLLRREAAADFRTAFAAAVAATFAPQGPSLIDLARDGLSAMMTDAAGKPFLCHYHVKDTAVLALMGRLERMEAHMTQPVPPPTWPQT